MKKCLRYLKWKLLKRQQGNAGWTTFAKMNILPEYKVNKQTGQVTGMVKYNGETHLCVIVDRYKQTVQTKGSLRKIKQMTAPFTKKHYIEMITNEAAFLLEHEGETR